MTAWFRTSLPFCRTVAILSVLSHSTTKRAWCPERVGPITTILWIIWATHTVRRFLLIFCSIQCRITMVYLTSQSIYSSGTSTASISIVRFIFSVLLLSWKLLLNFTDYQIVLKRCIHTFFKHKRSVPQAIVAAIGFLIIVLV